jgi:hypothetical protein
MTLQSSGPISLSDIKAEFGGVDPISLRDYYALASGLPASGAISFSDFYGRRFIVYETITSDRAWSPKVNLANFIQIWVMGAGGSGGHGWPDTSGFTEGAASGSGGGAGGVAVSRIAASSLAGSYSITVGDGGVGVRLTDEGSRNGNAGSGSRFSGGGLDIRGNGGGAGQARYSSTSGSDTADSPGGIGGTATGGNLLNLQGGSGGRARATGEGSRRCSSGGGAPRFRTVDDGDGADAGNEGASAGRKAQDYSGFPPILTTYITGRNQTAIISSSIASFDATNGSNSGTSGSAIYGAGSGGCGQRSATGTGRGGNGIVYIIYEI